MNVDVIIVGGGITGLSAAWTLQSLGVKYALFESDGRWGGKIMTAREAAKDEPPFIMDAGAESFITRKPEVWKLAHDLGLADDIVPLKSQARGVHILHAGGLYPVPITPGAFISSRLLSAKGKLRLLAEPFIPPRRDAGDESLADFARRRLGSEASLRMMEPVLGGIYNADPEAQSVLVSAPHMRELERQHGSLVRGMIASRRNRRQGAFRPAFITFKNGVDELVAALVKHLIASLHLNSPVDAIRRDGDGYEICLRGGETHHARGVILATPANIAAHLLRDLLTNPSPLSQLLHTGIGTVLMGFRSSDLPERGAMTGIMLPRREGHALDALLWTSLRVPARAPQGYTLLKAFFGGAQPHLLTFDDQHVVDSIRTELRQLLDIEAVPVLQRVFRWHDSYPLTTVGHLGRVATVKRALPPNVFVAGSSYEGIGVPDCIRQGQTAADDAARSLGLIV